MASSSSRSGKAKRQYTRDGTLTSAGVNISGPGIWVTYVRGKDRFAADSVATVLDELVDELYPGALEAHRVAKAAAAAERELAAGREADLEPEAGSSTGAGGGGDEFDEEMRKELEELRLEREAGKGKAKRPPGLIIRRNTDVDCLLFFSVLPPVDPLRLTLHILQRLSETGVTHLEHVQRLLPATASCPATAEDVERCAKDKVLPAVFGQGKPVRYKVLYQAAQSTGADRDVLIKTLADAVPQGQGHAVDLSSTTAEWLISARLFRSTASLALIPNAEWEALKRFNVPACKEMGLRRAEEAGTSGRGGRVVVPGGSSQQTGAPPPS